MQARLEVVICGATRGTPCGKKAGKFSRGGRTAQQPRSLEVGDEMGQRGGGVAYAVGCAVEDRGGAAGVVEHHPEDEQTQGPADCSGNHDRVYSMRADSLPQGSRLRRAA